MNQQMAKFIAQPFFKQ